MIKHLISIILTALVAMISACTYSESGIYRVDPVPGDPPMISAHTNLDTIIDPTVIDSLEVIYNVDIENGKFYQVEAFVFDKLVHSSDTTHGSFWITSAFVTDTVVDTLSLYFFHSTNSNSLADIVGLEYDYIELDYPIIFEEGGRR
ncbi:MAG: hypothetical protein ABFS38_00225 [Bacteroidota bacterium]